MNSKLLLTIVETASCIFLVEPALLELLKAGLDYGLDALIDDPQTLLNPPANNNNSIKYNLYTPESKDTPCYIEPSAEQFDKCSFNSSQETKILIHGYVAVLPPGNRYINYTGASPGSFHCIGHSLGSHVCGLAGRLTPNIRRITGLDPGGISKFLGLRPNIRLRPTDADFVDVIHTSEIKYGTGTGYQDPIGDMDFYPNGGVQQNHCQPGRRYELITGKMLTVQTAIDNGVCNHYIVLAYFENSISDNCRFVATKCSNFSSYEQNSCSLDGPPDTAEMGFHSKKIPGLPPQSKFYLKTPEFPPYCNERS